MNLKNLFTPNLYYETKELKKLSQLEEEIKKKPEKSTKTNKVINASSELVYIKFYLKGKILVLFDEKPSKEVDSDNPFEILNKETNPLQIIFNKETNPLQIIYTKDITRIITKLEGKPGFIRIEIGKNNWDIKSDQKNKWIEAISYFSKFYKNDKDFVTRDYSDSLDLLIMNRIKMEDDLKNWKDIWQNFDFTDFISDKDMTLLFDLNLTIVIKNRLLISKIEERTFIRTDKLRSVLKSNFSVDEKKKSEFKLTETNQNFIVLLGQNPLTKIEETYYRDDIEILKKLTIMPWMEFNLIYFFNYLEMGDNSPFINAYLIEDIESVILVEDGKTLKLQLKDRYVYLRFQTHFESYNWLNAIKNAMHFLMMKQRSQIKDIGFNIELFYELKSYKQSSIIKANLLKVIQNLDSNNDIGVFFSSFIKVNNAVNTFIDSFYARVPFNGNFLKYCIFFLHTIIRTEANKFWNKNYKEFSALEAIDFASIIYFYLEILSKWNLKDYHLINWEVPLINTFLYQLYEKLKEILFNILISITEQVAYKNGKPVNNSSDMIEGQLNFIFDHYKKVSTTRVAFILIDACSFFFMTFLRYISYFLNENEYDLDMYLSLLNNNYLTIIRNFIKRVLRDVDKKIPKKKIKLVLREDTLNRLIIGLEEFCHKKIKIVLEKEMNSKLAKIEFLNLNIDEFFGKNLVVIEETMNKLNPGYADKFYKELFKNLLKVYFTCFIDYIPKLKEKDYPLMVNKIEEDKQICLHYLQKYFILEIDEFEFFFNNLYKLIESQDIDQICIVLMNFHIMYNELITDNSIKNIVQCKIFFPKDAKNYILKYLGKSLVKFANVEKAKKKLGKAFYVVYLVFKFVYIIKKNYRLKKKIFTGISKVTTKLNVKMENKKPEKPKYESMFYSYESIYQTRGSVEVYKFKNEYSNSQMVKYIKNKIDVKAKWKKYYLFFNVGCLTLSENSIQTEIFMNILYTTIQDIVKVTDSCFFLKEKSYGFALNFNNTNPSKCESFFEKMKIMKDCFEIKETTKVELDMTNFYGPLVWNSILPVFKFDFNYYKEKDEAKVVTIEFDSQIDYDNED